MDGEEDEEDWTEKGEGNVFLEQCVAVHLCAEFEPNVSAIGYSDGSAVFANLRGELVKSKKRHCQALKIQSFEDLVFSPRKIILNSNVQRHAKSN